MSTVKMKFKDAPIGARFKFPNPKLEGDTWIKINSYPKGLHNDGRGLVVKWNGNVEGFQTYCCWVDEENRYNYDTEIELLPENENQYVVDLEVEIEKLKHKLLEETTLTVYLKSTIEKIESLLKEALEYYHNDRYSTRAKAMKTRIDEALDILNQTEDD